MESVNITSARQHLYEIAQKTVETSQPIRITSKSGDVVMLSAADWSAIEETLYLQSIPGMTQSLLDAAKEPIEEGIALEDFDWDADV